MTVQKTITIEVSMFSEASEADLSSHFESFIGELKSKVENMRFDDWHKIIHTSWDDCYPVEIDVSILVSKKI